METMPADTPEQSIMMTRIKSRKGPVMLFLHFLTFCAIIFLKMCDVLHLFPVIYIRELKTGGIR